MSSALENTLPLPDELLRKEQLAAVEDLEDVYREMMDLLLNDDRAGPGRKVTGIEVKDGLKMRLQCVVDGSLLEQACTSVDAHLRYIQTLDDHFAAGS